ncbi:hypothetical protein HPB52_020338 [Rhipicephalus sanguineus]|uniref:Uncharacterized protein n=1 Tax=Rhipicephalus sanguineus TaxID=34632 RepID=A0A9D4PSP7_RHISA|nr:hypothetical protein HPB52_020338 [Rhipicephalus sanguineus]
MFRSDRCIARDTLSIRSAPLPQSAGEEAEPEDTVEDPPSHLVDHDYLGAPQPAMRPRQSRNPPPLHPGRQTPVRQMHATAAELAEDQRRLLALQEQMLLQNAHQWEAVREHLSAIEAAQRRQADALVEIATVLRDAFGGGQQPRRTQGDS